MSFIISILRFSFILQCILFIVTAKVLNDPLIQLKHGKIRGHVLKSENGNDYYAFQEIPYAAPPVGENRFQLPKEPNPWTGILDTTKNTKICYQVPSQSSDLEVSEDCLYVNVYTPVVPGSNVKKLPVLFWIHGGVLQRDSGAYEYFGPKYIMDHDVVVVTINYRLGPFGFTTTEDDIIPANLGLKDQKFAIEWVHKNIDRFGGDPKQVTIVGESAGGWSVGMQVIAQSNSNEKLFHGAIMQSGSPLGLLLQANARSNAFELGRVLDKKFSSNSSSDLLEVLQKAPASEILSAVTSVGTVIIEKEGDFSYNPLQSFMDGSFSKIPILMGFNSEEWLSAAMTPTSTLAQYDSDPSLLIEGINVSNENRSFVGQLLKTIYTNTSFVDDLGAFVRWSSDIKMTLPICKQAQLASSQTPVFFYQFSYDGEMGQNLPNFNVSGTEKVSHAEDLHYMWDVGSNSDLSNFSEGDQLTLHRFVKMWTNFVKYQNPTPISDSLLNNIIWPTTNSENLQYLNFNITLELREHPRQFKQVEEVMDKYMEPPFVLYGE